MDILYIAPPPPINIEAQPSNSTSKPESGEVMIHARIHPPELYNLTVRVEYRCIDPVCDTVIIPQCQIPRKLYIPNVVVLLCEYVLSGTAVYKPVDNPLALVKFQRRGNPLSAGLFRKKEKGTIRWCNS